MPAISPKLTSPRPVMRALSAARAQGAAASAATAAAQATSDLIQAMVNGVARPGKFLVTKAKKPAPRELGAGKRAFFMEGFWVTAIAE